MIRGRRALAVVPARGGSRGIPRKNLRRVGGRSLVAWAANVVAGVPMLDRAVVSTDDEEIAAEAARHGLDAPFRRPAALSGDRIGDVPVLQHALEVCERLDRQRYDVIVMLQPTSPLRTPQDVEMTIRRLVDEDLDSVWTVSAVPLHHHPLKQLDLRHGRLTTFDPRGAAIVSRQELQPTYVRNGAAYALTRECLLDAAVLLGARASAVVIDEPRPNIDDERDLAWADELLRARVPPADG